MIIVEQLNLKIPHSILDVEKKLRKTLGISDREELDFSIKKRSVDARKKPELCYSYVLCAKIKKKSKKEAEKAEENIIKRCKNPKIHKGGEVNFLIPKVAFYGKRPVVIGAGPGGMFCALSLCEAGFSPILLERGEAVDERRKTVETFWNGGTLNEESNVSFGEGGAGTFSDGKLNTQVKDKDGRLRKVLKTFVEMGGDESILYDAMPHVGTDVLTNIVKNIRKSIIKQGGEVRFGARVTDIIIRNNRVCGIIINGKEELETDTVITAIGHSARDTFDMLHKHNVPMEAKDFAVGFRVAHSQELINKDRYGIKNPCSLDKSLGAAPYKLTSMDGNKRGIYSFCMCPGGYIVNASSEKGRLCINGMSYSKRDGSFANSAIIVTVKKDEYHSFLNTLWKDKKNCENLSKDPLLGMYFQREIEKKAYGAGGGSIPVMAFGDFKKACIFGKNIQQLSDVSMPDIKGNCEVSDITGILPMELNLSFIQGMDNFGGMIKGFNDDNVPVAAVESRTSSPVRIIRDEGCMSEIEGLYPCGEGAGYAGGITSAAMDGLKVAAAIAGKYSDHNKDL